MVTDRDREVVEWIGRLAAGAADVMARFRMDAPPRTGGSRRWWTPDCWPPSGCSTGTLRSMSPRARGWRGPAWIALIHAGWAWGSARHYALCARLAVALERTETAYDVWSEREVRVAELEVGAAVASSELGAPARWSPAPASRGPGPHAPR